MALWLKCSTTRRSPPQACVGREDDVKFVGLYEARGIPVLRIGVTDNSGTLEIQDVAGWQLSDMRAAHKGTLAELFG
jgi:phosphoribosylformylglycinamidine synthase